MIECVKAALPFVICGVCLAVLAVNHKKAKAEENSGNYMMEGMCFGMCLGVSCAQIIHVNIGVGISLGMLIGETVGFLIKKK